MLTSCLVYNMDVPVGSSCWTSDISNEQTRLRMFEMRGRCILDKCVRKGRRYYS